MMGSGEFDEYRSRVEGFARQDFPERIATPLHMQPSSGSHALPSAQLISTRQRRNRLRLPRINPRGLVRRKAQPGVSCLFQKPY
jgi:hypothetical protein